MTDRENILLTDKHVLIHFGVNHAESSELAFLRENFCGRYCETVENLVTDSDTVIFACGDISQSFEALKNVDHMIVCIIAELSVNYEDAISDQVINLGQVPLNICGMGVYFRQLFSENNYFDRIREAHDLRTMTESDKPNKSLRYALYIARVKQAQEGLWTHLMRCSSNIDGPTDNFRAVDEEIVGEVNRVCSLYFKERVDANHILTQVYNNTKSAKAKISMHSDKTEDMTDHGIIAFFTCYNGSNMKSVVRSSTDPFDFCYRSSKGAATQTSVYTSLYFRLKTCVDDPNLPQEFTIKLYQNSVFIIPLSTNRLYTHETRPSTLPYDKIPTRLSSVIKCSKTEILYMDDGNAFIIDDKVAPKYSRDADGCPIINVKTAIDRGFLKKLEPMTRANLTEMRKFYFLQNTTADLIDYPFMGYSMNTGDYPAPNK